MRLTDALVSQLQFQKGKDAEVAWIDAQFVFRESQLDARPIMLDEEEPMDGTLSFFLLVIYKTKLLNT